MTPVRFVTHSKKVQQIAAKEGWLPGARYTNLRDVRAVGQLGFLDIDWKCYDFGRHLNAAKLTRPFLTVARDIENIDDYRTVLEQAEKLSMYARYVVIVPKDPRMADSFAEIMPVFSFDCNRFTLDAAFGDYFDGERFRRHPRGGV